MNYCAKYNKLCDSANAGGYCSLTACNRYLLITNETPTVEAIPISYIQNQIERWERSKTESYHAICYRHLIEEWEMETRKENGG